MSNHAISIDIKTIGSATDLLQLAEEVKATKTPKVLTKDDEALAVLVPADTADAGDEIPNAYFLQMAKEAKKDRETGKASPVFQTTEEMNAWLHKQGV
jgi:hypothetical protein